RTARRADAVHRAVTEVVRCQDHAGGHEREGRYRCQPAVPAYPPLLAGDDAVDVDVCGRRIGHRLPQRFADGVHVSVLPYGRVDAGNADEPGTQGLQGPGGLALDSARAAFQRLRGLLDGQVAEVAQDQHRAPARWQLGKVTEQGEPVGRVEW